MNFIKTKISDVVIIEPRVFRDTRGYFLESYNQKKFEEFFGKILFVQDNESKSSKGVLRGLHFQKPPFDQAKLVRCIEGEILDVAVDIRKNSKTYGEYVSVLLSDENKRQLFISKGFAHGFLVLSNSATIAYKVDNIYSQAHDAGLRWNDKDLNIQWGVEDSVVKVSEKDAKLPFFLEFESPFTKQNMRVLITGSNGQLGSEIKDLSANYKLLEDTVTFFGAVTNILNEDYDDLLGFSRD